MQFCRPILAENEVNFLHFFFYFFVTYLPRITFFLTFVKRNRKHNNAINTLIQYKKLYISVFFLSLNHLRLIPHP